MNNQDGVVDLTELDEGGEEKEDHISQNQGTKSYNNKDDDNDVILVLDNKAVADHPATRLMQGKKPNQATVSNTDVIDLSSTVGAELMDADLSLEKQPRAGSSTTLTRPFKRTRRQSSTRTTDVTINRKDEVIDVDAIDVFSLKHATKNSSASVFAVTEDPSAAEITTMPPTPEDEYRKEMGRLRMQFVNEFSPPHTFQQQAQSTTMTNARGMQKLYRELTEYQLNLPIQPNSSIFVRVMESQTDLIRVLITGPVDTPYANGMFFFDCYLRDYPNSPPQVQFLTTKGNQVRFNPNLYACGKVCLSLLGTWSGPGWVPNISTLLQVLVSIQGLILVSEPFYNEPGYEHYMVHTEHNSNKSTTNKTPATRNTSNFSKQGMNFMQQRMLEQSVEYSRKIRQHTVDVAILAPLREITSKMTDTAATTNAISTGKKMDDTTTQRATGTIAKTSMYLEFHSVIERHYRLRRDCLLRQLEEWTTLDPTNGFLTHNITTIHSMLDKLVDEQKERV